MQHNGDDAQQQSSAFRIWFSVILYHLIKTGRANFRPPALFILADEGFRRVNRLGNVGVFPDVDVQPVGSLAVNEALHDKGQRRDAVHRAAFEGTDVHAVKQVDGKAVLAEFADDANSVIVRTNVQIQTLRHAGEHTSV